ncbi:MAG: LVIVD repeat-containing protein, partial [Candidatus Binatia bacterium]
LNGAENLAIAGNYVYVVCDRGLVIVDFDQPLQPKIVAEVPTLVKPTGIAVQFRYAFVTDKEGLKVIEITNPLTPRVVAKVPIEHAYRVYVARTYAYVAAGPQGIVIVDVERPEHPFIDQVYNADGKLNDVHDVKVGATNVSLFAYVADGKNGLRVLQLTSPETTPGYLGFSPRPAPKLIATRHTHGEALAVAKGLDRDRAVDESGNQVSVFNRIGARPLTLPEMQRLYLRGGQVYQVDDVPPGSPEESMTVAEKAH